MDRYACHLELTFERDWDLASRAPAFTHYNIPPRLQVPIVRLRADDQREAVMARWGLLAPGGVVSRAGRTRLRAVQLDRAPWRVLWEGGRRCIFPMLGFYLWQPPGNLPWFVHLARQRMLGVAGVWNQHDVANSSTPLLTAALLTVTANSYLAGLQQSRRQMPAILAASDYDTWLAGEPAAARALLKPFPASEMRAWRVSPRVNDPACTGPDCMIQDDTAHATGSAPGPGASRPD